MSHTTPVSVGCTPPALKRRSAPGILWSMIYDRIGSHKSYKGISKNLDAAFAWLAGGAADGLADGRHSIKGDDIYVIISSYETKAVAEARFEAHARYIDIQVVLEGKETCFWAPASGLTPSAPWDDAKDLGFFSDPGSGKVALPLAPGFFAVFFPQDAHKPSCHALAKGKVHKAVVKVRV